ncbi:hypothetical protein R1flu_001467 [Riccia fluitans]|uniref:Uncharacterized protein n=1 Tax=Riccia fluitans TaxID=41844 RepID=A0ABD1Y6C1_9MARC
MSAGDEDANIHEDRKLARLSRPGVEDRELARQDHESRPAHDKERITILELEKPLNSGADVETLCHALLEARFAVGMKEKNPMDHIPEYFRLWD